MHFEKSDEVGYENLKLGGIVHQVLRELREAGLKADMRDVMLGHLQRGGVPVAYDRVLAAQFGVKAFEMVLNEQFGQMVSYQHPDIVAVPLKEAIGKPNLVTLDNRIIQTVKGLDICLGDNI
jgi:6-phosphofructokinase 1